MKYRIEVDFDVIGYNFGCLRVFFRGLSERIGFGPPSLGEGGDVADEDGKKVASWVVIQ